jgi:hypothetical protein
LGGAGVFLKILRLLPYTATTGSRLPSSIRTISSDIRASEIIRILAV